jgi:hypothetical protein
MPIIQLRCENWLNHVILGAFPSLSLKLSVHVGFQIDELVQSRLRTNTQQESESIRRRIVKKKIQGTDSDDELLAPQLGVFARRDDFLDLAQMSLTENAPPHLLLAPASLVAHD